MKPIATQPQPDLLPVIEVLQQGSLDVWAAACGTIFDVSPVNHQDSNQYSARTWYVEPLIVAQTSYHSMVSNHNAHHIQESGGYLNVHRYVSDGTITVDSNSMPLSCERGDIVFLDYSRPFRSVHPNNICQSFIVPHAAIGYAPSDARHAFVLTSDSKMGHLIGQEMDAILSQLSQGEKLLSELNVQRFLGCVEVAMSPGHASKSARAFARESLKHAIMDFIEQNLSKPDMNVTLILRNFGVSRASLYRMFEKEDGVRNYINQRRLCRAVIDLAARPNVRGQIHRVAERWGFKSDASFNRTVRRSFGLAPGSLFQMPFQAATPSRQTSMIHDLTQNLTHQSIATVQSQN